MIICPNPICRATDHESDAMFCYHCGTSLYEMKCPICKKSDPRPGAKFCQKCGSTLQLSVIEQDGPVPIDLGLPSGTKWASCNVGATKPEECGGFYAWGETEEKGKEVWYTWGTYKHCHGGWNSCNHIGSDIGRISGTEYDVAHVVWGDNWEMPTFEQIKELVKECQYEWSTLNSINGGIFTGPNGNSIFIPVSGCRHNNQLTGTFMGCYWSGSMDHRHDYYAKCLFFNDLGVYIDQDNNHDYRYNGLTIRPVLKNDSII